MVDPADSAETESNSAPDLAHALDRVDELTAAQEQLHAVLSEGFFELGRERATSRTADLRTYLFSQPVAELTSSDPSITQHY